MLREFKYLSMGVSSKFCSSNSFSLLYRVNHPCLYIFRWFLLFLSSLTHTSSLIDLTWGTLSTTAKPPKGNSTISTTYPCSCGWLKLPKFLLQESIVLISNETNISKKRSVSLTFDSIPTFFLEKKEVNVFGGPTYLRPFLSLWY